MSRFFAGRYVFLQQKTSFYNIFKQLQFEAFDWDFAADGTQPTLQIGRNAHFGHNLRESRRGSLDAGKECAAIERHIGGFGAFGRLDVFVWVESEKFGNAPRHIVAADGLRAAIVVDAAEFGAQDDFENQIRQNRSGEGAFDFVAAAGGFFALCPSAQKFFVVRAAAREAVAADVAEAQNDGCLRRDFKYFLFREKFCRSVEGGGHRNVGIFIRGGGTVENHIG